MSHETRSFFSNLFKSPDRSPKRVDPRTSFLLTLKKQFGIQRIYYPGFGQDYCLEKAFEPKEIFYVDRDEGLKPRHHFLRADLNKSPFIGDAFDAVFVQDIHMVQRNIDALLRVLRPNGVLIFSNDDCGDYDEDEIRSRQLKQNPLLKKIKLPYSYSWFDIFQKIDRTHGDLPVLSI